jgi:ABC-type transport system involved in cytochrome c biogenesis permease subunit
MGEGKLVLADQILQGTAAVYLVAGLVGGLGLALGVRRLERASVALLVFGVVLQGSFFFALHSAENPPPLTHVSLTISFMTWISVSFYLLLLRRSRLRRLVSLVAAVAFVGAFLAALSEPGVVAPSEVPDASDVSSSWSHVHVLFASAGSALLGLAGLAGMMFLVEHRRLKAKRLIDRRLPLPSLEALDRVNVVSLTTGFSLLTLGVITGMLWLQAVHGKPWTGTVHETWSFVAWVVYAVLIGARFMTQQGAREAAASSVGCFALLLFAVIGLGFIT